MDKYEREPMTFVLLHFLWGAFGAIALGLIGSLMLGDMTGIKDEGNGSIIQTIFFAPVSEEIAKGIFLLFTITSLKFDNITDGLVYGGAIGLGFGMTENFSYFISYGDNPANWIFLVVVRTAFSAVMHCISTATFGAFLGLAKFSLSKFRSLFPIAGLLLAMFFHFMWNASVSFPNTFIYGFIFMLLLIFVFFAIFRLSIAYEKKIIIKELSEESDLLLLPKEHIPIISSHLRLRKGWIDERIRKQYFRSAIKLAFAKMKTRKSDGYFHQQYLYEVENNRQKIRALLASINGNL
jgi:RsiW-degrading membrane proteinase PrsW (M82 family)